MNGGRVLIIAGSDSGGGAGIQADIKTVTCLGGYAATAITALTAQNTLGVHGVHPVPEAFIRQQIQAVMEDLGADCLKTGMLGSAAIIEAVVAAVAAHAPRVPLVVDPVMVAKGGHPLLEPEAMDALRSLLVPRAALLTPNAPEAVALTGLPLDDVAQMTGVAEALLTLGPRAVLLKGGHLPGHTVQDVLMTAAGDVEIFLHPRVDSQATHGTGCTLASACAVGLAQGRRLALSVRRARSYVRTAILTAPGLGQGHGPLNHGHTVMVPV